MAARGWRPDSGRCALVGMVHLAPLPGSPRGGRPVNEIVELALADARALVAGGCDALIVENMGDLPYLKGHVPPETVASMALATAAVVELGIPTGVQVLAGANRQALGVAVAAGAKFLRVEAFAYGHVADEGWMDASAGPLMRAVAALDADVAIWADVQKKHAAHAITGDLELQALAEGAVFCGADVLIATGGATGDPTDPHDVDAIRAAGLPVAVGSGVTAEGAARLASHADALIVGSALKYDGDWRQPVEQARVTRLRATLDAIQGWS
ncbi:MAG: BtpA/SgcQ family protein [Bradymonadia bacterium]